MKIYVATEWRRSGKRKDRMKLSLPPKLVEKLVWVPVLSFCKIFIPSYTCDALLCRTWPFSPPNRVTLQITPLYSNKHRERGIFIIISIKEDGDLLQNFFRIHFKVSLSAWFQKWILQNCMWKLTTHSVHHI